MMKEKHLQNILIFLKKNSEKLDINFYKKKLSKKQKNFSNK